MKKETRELVSALQDQGFTTRATAKGHIAVGRHGATVVVLAGTPSDWRSMRNAVARLRRAGFIFKS